ncbi:hypothetical protein [Paenibacillus polymyxa]|uniref:hypothetical protein n=1 Tax=Paenibacillus polymyxa TaxID=1406 RepID=UPI00046FAF6A|nr:hypothetical protein [Paenibacillus polymyxa]
MQAGLVSFSWLDHQNVFFFYGAVIGLEKITGVVFKKWIFPLAALIYGLSFLSPNYTHHIVIGRKIVLNTWFPIFQISLPLLLFVVIVIKKKKTSE